MYLVVTRPTKREDASGRKIVNSIVMRADNLEAACRVFDARHSLLEWSENRWQRLEGSTDKELLKILDKTNPRTTEKDLEDSSKWTVHSITANQDWEWPILKPKPRGFAAFVHSVKEIFKDTPPPDKEPPKQIGTLHYHEE